MRKLAVLFLGLAVAITAHATSTINTINAYAWGANIGWTNWRPNAPSPGEGVIIGEFICSGYILGREYRLDQYGKRQSREQHSVSK